LISDLAANRAGRITRRQRLRLLRGEAALLFLTGVGLIVSIALGPNLLGAFRDLGFFGGFVVTLFFLVCAVMTLVGGFGVVVLLGDLVLGHIRSVTGRPTLRRVGVTTNAFARPIPSSFTYPGQYKYKVMVDDREFDVDSRLADQLSRDSRKIRVYYAAYSGEMLSLEPLEVAQEAS
jgi:hypothetical protein